MKRYIAMVSWILMIVLFHSVNGQCLQVDLRGRLESNFVLRDIDGFQYGFLDDNRGIQWRNTLKFDLTLRPEQAGAATYRLDKVFLSYRGAYDAIFELTDRYDNLEEKSLADYQYGKDDIEWENDLREAFVDLVAEEGRTTVNLRIGRQIVQWGEADGFNLVNVVCPDDYSYQMFFSDVEDLATPLWMARLNYNTGGFGFLNSLGFEFIAIPDIRPDQFAPLTDLDGNFTTEAPYGFAFQDFDGFSQWNSEQFIDPLFGIPTWGFLTPAQQTKAQLKYREDVPDRKFDNMEYGISLSFGIGDLQTSLHYFVGHQDEPAVDTSDTGRFLGEYGAYMGALLQGFPLPPDPVGPTAVFTHPRQRMLGLSFNYFVSWANAVFRGEGSWTKETHLPYTNSPKQDFLRSHRVYQSLLAIDKDLHPKWIGTTSALTWNIQGYWRHVAGLEDGERFLNPWTGEDLGRAYPYDLHDSYRVTMMLMTDYYHGEIAPSIFAMYDPEGTWMTNASLKYTPSNNWQFKLTQMSFWGNKTAVSPFAGNIGVSEISFKVAYRF